jgi:hypothetical protein
MADQLTGSLGHHTRQNGIRFALSHADSCPQRPHSCRWLPRNCMVPSYPHDGVIPTVLDGSADSCRTPPRAGVVVALSMSVRGPS